MFDVDVESYASTFEEAKKEGFRLAVEYAVGSLILSETEVRSDRMKRDEIITYASGFVEDFKILSREKNSPCRFKSEFDILGVCELHKKKFCCTKDTTKHSNNKIYFNENYFMIGSVSTTYME